MSTRIPRDVRHDLVMADIVEQSHYDNQYTGGDEAEPYWYIDPHVFIGVANIVQPVYFRNTVTISTISLWVRGTNTGRFEEMTPLVGHDSVGYESTFPERTYARINLLDPEWIEVDDDLWEARFTINRQVSGAAILLARFFSDVPEYILGSSQVEGVQTYSILLLNMMLTTNSLYFRIKSDAQDAPVLDSLGVQLSEANVLGCSVNWASPFSGQLGSGALKEQDLTAYKVLSQNDWRGGRGQENAYTHPTKRFLDALADTRFSEMAVLPPMPTRTILDSGTAQSFTPGATQPGTGVNAFISGTGVASGQQAAQSFTTGGSGYTLTQVRLKLEKDTAQGSWGLTLLICADNAGAPGSTLATFTMPSTTDYDSSVGNPKYISFTGTYALNAGTTYWIVPLFTLSGNLSGASMYWHNGGAEAYSGGVGKSRTQSAGTWGAWADALVDFTFICNNGNALPTDITVQPVEFNGVWYCASGTGVYKYDTGTSKWSLTKAFTYAITSMAVLGDTMFAAFGDTSSNIYYSTDGVTWASNYGSDNRRYTYLKAYNGYLYAIKATGGSASLAYYANGTWAGAAIGTSNVVLTGLVGFNNQIIITSTTGLFSLSTSYVYQILDFSSQRSATNGIGALTWMGSGLLYVPVRNSLLIYNGQTTQQGGLDVDTGLPVGEQGRISAMVGTANWLFAAVDAGATGRSAIYAYNGGWHCLVKAASTGARIRAMGIEAITGTVARLWYAEGTEWYYLEMPETTDNPYLYSGSKYQNAGYIIASRWLGELSGIEKDFQSVIVRSENCSAGQTIEVEIMVDRSGYWWNVGRITKSPVQELELQAPSMANKTTAAGCTTTSIVVDGSSTLSDMSVGAFVRIGVEVRQVVAIPSATTFTLDRELDDGAPAAGTIVYTSRPAGREIQIKATLRTTDSSKSPKLLSYSIRYMEQLMDKARLTVQIPIGDKISWRNGARESLTGKQLYKAVLEYGKRITPFWVLFPDGEEYRVKCSGSITWSGIARTAGPTKNQTVKGTLTMQLMEV